MSTPLNVWHVEHVHFLKLLDIVSGQLAAPRDEAGFDPALLHNALYYLRSFGDRFHHPREDMAFARLVERDPSSRTVISRLKTEHQTMAQAGNELFRRVSELRPNDVPARASAKDAAIAYVALYKRHIATEERDVMPRARQHLLASDWHDVAANVPPDPLFGDVVELRFQALRDRLSSNG